MLDAVIFIDRDGTLVDEPKDFQIDALEKIKLKPYVIPALQQLIKAGFQLIMVTNQDGLGTELFPTVDFERCQNFILDIFSSQGINFNKIFICPHKPEDNCACRKPNIGLVKEYINTVDCERSWMIGDRLTDKFFADNIGVSFLEVSDINNWQIISEKILNSPLPIRLQRKTKETDIQLTLMCLSERDSCIETPIPFFSHMLEQVAKHGGFSLQLKANGDNEVDCHHLIEDTALALGEALRQSLGNKQGIERYGFTLPMDESLAFIALDLSGRPFCKFQGRFTREYVGTMATEMVPHFFRSLADGLRATIHIKTQGENHHHMIEACFKVLGRALKRAMAKTGQALPSTKGIL